MSSLNKKIIVVVGATGNQGSSVAHTFLKLSNWHVRCLTRNPSSSAAQDLSTLGAEVVKADLSDLSSLSKAFENANAIFVNTNFWETFRALAARGEEEKASSKAAYDLEVLHGKNAAIAAGAVPSLERFVYSALSPIGKYSNGKYSSGHWDGKAAIVEYIKDEQSELAKKASFIYLGAYTTNAMLSPRFDPASGKYSFVLPLTRESRMPIIDANVSTGLFVRGLIEDEAAGTKLLAYDSYLSVGELVAVWSKASGREAVLVEVSVDTMHQKFGIPMELLDAPSFITEFGYMGGVEGAIEPSQLQKKILTKPFEKWLEERDWNEVLGPAEV